MFAIMICFVLLMCTLTIRSVLMVKDMSDVVNVMLSRMNVMSPYPALCNLSAFTAVNLCNLGVFALGVSLIS